MAQAAKDMDEKKEKDLFDAQLKKKLILKKKSDKEYEAYWSKQKGAHFNDIPSYFVWNNPALASSH